jgi:hypothetical protein
MLRIADFLDSRLEDEGEVILTRPPRFTQKHFL